MLDPGVNVPADAWSGSTVVDTDNTSGLKTGTDPVMVADHLHRDHQRNVSGSTATISVSRGKPTSRIPWPLVDPTETLAILTCSGMHRRTSGSARITRAAPSFYTSPDLKNLDESESHRLWLRVTPTSTSF